MARYLSLALLVAATAAVPVVDFAQLFNRLTIPLGTVRVGD